MATPLVLFHSTIIPSAHTITNKQKLCLRQFNKHLQCHLTRTNPSLHHSSNPLITSLDFSFNHKRTRTPSFSPAKCAFSDTFHSDSHSPSLKTPFQNLSLDSIKSTLSQLTPVRIIKWCTILSISIAAVKSTLNLLFSPFFWMYFSWSWIFWPWFIALGLAIYGLYCFRKYSINKANTFEQLAIVTSLFTWLTLVPPAFFNGFLEGWPFAFFFVYHYFFFFNVSVRKRLYGDYYSRPHDPKWDSNPPRWQRLLFCVSIMAAHWLAAFEGPELHQIPGGLSNVGIWIMILVTLLMQYNSTLYLAKYSEKVVVPTAVVQFGPYRWVRHPIYTSTMLLFCTYCVALRAPLSLVFLLGVCLVYYEQKAKIEEALMIESFGDSYLEYANRVRYKFIPLVY